MAKRTTKKVEEVPEEITVEVEEVSEEMNNNELPLLIALMMNAMNKTKESTKAKQAKIYETMSSIKAVRN